jgi:cleavage and polyadenylation specificity factor subunit 4
MQSVHGRPLPTGQQLPGQASRQSYTIQQVSYDLPNRSSAGYLEYNKALTDMITNSLICKHWMRGLCKKGESCEFLHEYNLRRMPECNHWQRHQICPQGDDCPYQHTDPAFKRPLCPHYERGFCPLGPICANRHVRRDKICPYYLAGFCPNGRGCQEGVHPRFPNDLKKPEVMTQKTPEELEREREEREKQAREEEERDREREERMGGTQGQGGQQKFGARQWQGRRRNSGPRHKRPPY